MTKTIITAFVAIGLLCGCSPMKGYEGPELPEEKVAIVYPANQNFDRQITRATVNGIEVPERGISLLPGENDFQVSAAMGSRPHNCRPYEEFDSYGYESCLNDRESDLEKGEKYPRSCYSGDYNKQKERCSRDYSDFLCQIHLSLAAGKRYELDVPASAAEHPEVYGYHTDRGYFGGSAPKALAGKGSCDYLGRRTEEEEYDGWNY